MRKGPGWLLLTTFYLLAAHEAMLPWAYLAGIRALCMRGCSKHLRGMHTLGMSNCRQNGGTGTSFAHLHGIHTNLIPTHPGHERLRQESIGYAAFELLARVHSLRMWGCRQGTITDKRGSQRRGRRRCRGWPSRA